MLDIEIAQLERVVIDMHQSYLDIYQLVNLQQSA